MRENLELARDFFKRVLPTPSGKDSLKYGDEIYSTEKKHCHEYRGYIQEYYAKMKKSENGVFVSIKKIKIDALAVPLFEHWYFENELYELLANYAVIYFDFSPLSEYARVVFVNSERLNALTAQLPNGNVSLDDIRGACRGLPPLELADKRKGICYFVWSTIPLPAEFLNVYKIPRHFDAGYVWDPLLEDPQHEEPQTKDAEILRLRAEVARLQQALQPKRVPADALGRSMEGVFQVRKREREAEVNNNNQPHLVLRLK